MKFKIGNKVKIRQDLKVNKKYGDLRFTEEMQRMKGKIVTIKEKYYNGYCIEEFNYYWTDEMFEDKAIFTKSDLKDGDIVTYRNGDKRYVDAINKNIVYIDNHYRLSFTFDNFNEDLTDKGCDAKYDIIKVERPTHYKTMFERKEEILDEVEKEYLKNFIEPFRNRVRNIMKRNNRKDREMLYIEIKDDFIKSTLPSFKENSMYRGMKKNKIYTLEELGL